MRRLLLIIGLFLLSTPAWAVDCQYRTTLPTLADQNGVILQCDTNGKLLVSATISAATMAIDQTTPGSTNGVNIAPVAAATAGIIPVVSTAAESSHVLKASAGNLYAYQVTTGAVAGYVMIFNATSAPVDGAVTPVKCVAVPATATVGVSNSPPEYFSTGITAVFSTTGCFTKTASATAMFSGDVK